MDNPPAAPEPSLAPPPAPAPTPAPAPAPAPATHPNVPSPQHLSFTGAVLSYLVPGLGQIAQGRTAKGVLFLLCIYFLFFYGMYLGAAEVKIGIRTYRVPSNVYVPQSEDLWWERGGPNGKQARSIKDFILAYPRPQLAAQVWVGAIVWPAFVQNGHVKKEQEKGTEQAIKTAWSEAEEERDPERQKKLVEQAEAL